MNVYKCAHGLCSALRLRFNELLREAAHEPVLFVYVNDGWGSNVTTRHTCSGTETKVIRNARFRHEFLLQIGVLRLGSRPGRPAGALTFVLDGAVSLRSGKRAWHCFQAGCDFMPLVRHMGHNNISCSFYVFDGLLSRPLIKRFRSRHRLYYSEHGPLSCPEPDRLLLALTDWVFGVKCASHTSSNGVKHGL